MIPLFDVISNEGVIIFTNSESLPVNYFSISSFKC